MWCTARKPKGSSYTRSLTKLFEHSYRSINNIYDCVMYNKFRKKFFKQVYTILFNTIHISLKLVFSKLKLYITTNFKRFY